MVNRKRVYTWSGLAIAFALLFAVNILSDAAFTSMRADLTENRLYTLTTGTKSILGRLQEPITLRLFLSQKEATRLPGINNYTQRVKELLREYERQAGGAIKLLVIDPEPFSEDEDRADAYGVSGVPLDDEGTTFYFGLVGTNSTDDEEVIPFFSVDREELLEHDLTKMVYQLSNTEATRVGLISRLPLDGGQMDPQAMAMGLNQGMPRPWVVFEQMQQLFDVVAIEPDGGAIPDDIGVLMVVHPKQLPPSMLYAIDQYVLGGGRVLVFVDPNSEVDRVPGMMGMAAPPGSSGLEPLFAAWGIGLADGKVAGDLSIAQRVRYGSPDSPGVIDYPVWMNLPVELNNADDVVTARLGNLVLASPGVLEDLGKEGVTVTPLVTTTENAMTFDVGQVQVLTDPAELLSGYQRGGERLNLAVRVSGRVETAFPGGPPPSEGEDMQNGEAATRTHLEASRQDVNLIIVADSDMLADDFWAQAQNLLGTRLVIPTAANGDFVINSLENLLGSNELISVRSRGQFSRPFTRVAGLQQEAEIRYRRKERELLASLEETERKLIELEKGSRNDQRLILSQDQLAEIENFRQEKIRIRKELRLVRHQLRKDIEKLESATKFINIGFVPLLIGIGGLLVGLRKLKRGNRGSQR
jgi:ABC-type uncharacterized transport system involved in gliding motility auxiliary subunit